MRLIRKRPARLALAVLGLIAANLGFAAIPAGAVSASSWRTQETIPALNEVVNGVSCPSRADCWAVGLTGAGGVVILSTAP
jgi:lipoate synthase